jgi:hypothetical protein
MLCGERTPQKLDCQTSKSISFGIGGNLFERIYIAVGGAF